jgi:hypothetical protein
MITVALWLPRLRGPLDLRYDAGVYYILGTALAEGKGYRLLSEPGEIQAIQYPPLLPLVIAAHQRVAGTSDPIVVGYWLRWSFLLLSIAYVVTVYRLGRRYLAPALAFLATLLTLLHVNTLWMSELLFAELPFAVTSVLFLLVVTGSSGRRRDVLAFLLGTVSFLLRVGGVALLAAWVGDSVLRGRFRQAAGRAVVACIPVLLWQGYVAQVHWSPEYVQPSYAYQRAGYQYYNVGYLENVMYVDPFTPERGRLSPQLLAGRVVENLTLMPAKLGEALSVSPRAVMRSLARVSERLDLPQPIPAWLVHGLQVCLGLGTLAGLTWLLRGEKYVVPLYAAASVALITLTPWPAQFGRYLMPIAPVLALGLLKSVAIARAWLSASPDRRWKPAAMRAISVLVSGLVGLQVAFLAVIFHSSRIVTYDDPRGASRSYRVFFYPESWAEHDAAIDWLTTVATPDDIVATSTPHWVYLKTGLRAVLPPFEGDARRAQQLINSVPVTYLIVDNLEFVDVARRYAAAVVEAFPERWTPVFSAPADGVRIYRQRAP